MCKIKIIIFIGTTSIRDGSNKGKVSKIDAKMLKSV